MKLKLSLVIHLVQDVQNKIIKKEYKV